MRLALYALTALAFWWVGSVRDDVACMALALAMVVVAACMAVLARVLARGVRTQVTSAHTEVRRGQNASFTLTLHNATHLPAGTFEMQAAVEWPGGQQLERTVDLTGTASARSELAVPLAARAAHCGVLRAEVRSLTTHDPLGLVRARRRPRSAGASMLVLPARTLDVRVLGTAGLACATGATSMPAGRGGQEPPDVADLRGWRPGDALHSVHWKLSARTGETMVKLYEDEENLGLVLACRLDERKPGGSPSPDEVDALLEATHALSLALVDAGVAHRLTWGPGAGAGRSVASLADEESCMRELTLYATQDAWDACAEDACRETPHRQTDAPEYLPHLDLGFDMKLKFRERVIANLAPAEGGTCVVDLTPLAQEMLGGRL